MKTRPLLAALALAAAGVILDGCSSAPAPVAEGPTVSLLEPANGATVSSPFKVRFGVKGMKVVVAGDMSEGTGHHHLLINQAPIPAGQVIPVTPLHIHFGSAQTEAQITLAPGSYRLTAQFGNGAHQSYGPPMSQTITITVK